jgi:hypothetical protein
VSRETLIRDAANHLDDKVKELFFRHLHIMRAGGLSTTEATAAVLSALEKLALVAVGMAVAGIESEVKRAASAELLIVEIASDLRSQIPTIVSSVDVAHRRAGLR